MIYRRQQRDRLYRIYSCVFSVACGRTDQITGRDLIIRRPIFKAWDTETTIDIPAKELPTQHVAAKIPAGENNVELLLDSQFEILNRHTFTVSTNLSPSELPI